MLKIQLMSWDRLNLLYHADLFHLPSPVGSAIRNTSPSSFPSSVTPLSQLSTEYHHTIDTNLIDARSLPSQCSMMDVSLFLSHMARVVHIQTSQLPKGSAPTPGNHLKPTSAKRPVHRFFMPNPEVLTSTDCNLYEEGISGGEGGAYLW